MKEVKDVGDEGAVFLVCQFLKVGVKQDFHEGVFMLIELGMADLPVGFEGVADEWVLLVLKLLNEAVSDLLAYVFAGLLGALVSESCLLVV